MVRPRLENLEDRVLLYNAYGGHWTYGSRITFSFAPDGTRVGGTPSVLFQTLNAEFKQATTTSQQATATWQQQLQMAAAVWQDAANINLSQVSDDGSPQASTGNQQGDPRFGDIRIFMVPLPSGVLAETFLPPSYNGGTNAGDIFFNSKVNWQIGSDYDLETVAIHEFGHALGLGESTVTSACMYADYNGIKQSLTTDDINGIVSVWGAPQPDRFNSSGLSNSSYTNPANITPYIGSYGQVVIPNLRLTSATPQEWFSVTVPSSTTGTMVVTEQSTKLSMLSPDLFVYLLQPPTAQQPWGSLLPVGLGTTTAYGATVSVSVTGATAGQTYLIGAGGGLVGGAPTGTFGLELNFGSQPQSPIPPPNTVVPQTTSQGGGVDLMYAQPVTIGKISGLGHVYRININHGKGTKNPPLGNSAAGDSLKAARATETTVDSTALVATAIAQPTLLVSGNAQVSDAMSSPAVSAPGSIPLALQALDDSLLTWKSKSPLSLFTKGNKAGFLLN